MRTPLAWTLRVTISPWNSLPDFLKEPMVAMSFSPWLFEPATIAASMAIDRPQAIDAAPLGAGAQRRMAAERPPPSRGHAFLPREEWAQPGSPRLRGGKPRGRKSRRRHCGKAIEACRPVARSRHQRPRGSRARQPCKEKTWRTWVRARGQAQRAKEQKPWRTEGRSQQAG